jgi:heptosyltransferase I
VHPLPPDPRIALVMMSAIGDVVHALPLAHSLRAAWPGARVTWVIQPVPHALVAPVAPVDDYLLFERAAGWRALPRFRSAASGREFDLVLDPHAFFKAGVATRLLRAPRRVGFDRARAPDLNWLLTNEKLEARPRAHVQDEVLEFADHLGIPRVLRWGLGPTPAEEARFSHLLHGCEGPLVALALASTHPEKDWPAARTAALAASAASDLGAQLLLVGGRSPREDAAAGAVRASVPGAVDLRAWDLRRLAYLLARVDAVVAPDTGPMHLAVALGTPTVALMGYTNPARVGPWRFRELMVDAFHDAGEAPDPRRPPRPGRTGRIQPAAVLERLERALRTSKLEG